jgi:hypothetical protein
MPLWPQLRALGQNETQRTGLDSVATTPPVKRNRVREFAGPCHRGLLICLRNPLAHHPLGLGDLGGQLLKRARGSYRRFCLDAPFTAALPYDPILTLKFR